jgi:hypothetical protein
MVPNLALIERVDSDALDFLVEAIKNQHQGIYKISRDNLPCSLKDASDYISKKYKNVESYVKHRWYIESHVSKNYLWLEFRLNTDNLKWHTINSWTKTMLSLLSPNQHVRIHLERVSHCLSTIRKAISSFNGGEFVFKTHLMGKELIVEKYRH